MILGDTCSLQLPLFFYPAGLGHPSTEERAGTLKPFVTHLLHHPEALKDIGQKKDDLLNGETSTRDLRRAFEQ